MSFPLTPSSGDDYTTSLGYVYRYVTDHWDYRTHPTTPIYGATGIQGTTGIQGSVGLQGSGQSADGTNYSFTDSSSVAQHCSPQSHASLLHPSYERCAVTADVWFLPTSTCADVTSSTAKPSTANRNITFVVGADGVYKIGYAFTLARDNYTDKVDNAGIFVDGTLVMQTAWGMGEGNWYNHTCSRLIPLTKDSTVQVKIKCSTTTYLHYYAGGPDTTLSMPVNLFVHRINR
jgi:hypothetical protein